MPRTSKIKWRQSDQAKLEKTLKNFNQRRNRLLKQHPELFDLTPERQVMKDILPVIKEGTRNDFNKFIKALDRFRGSDIKETVTYNSGLTLTKYQVKENQYKLNAINARRRNQLKKILQNNPKLINEDLTTTGGIDIDQYKPKKVNYNRIKPGKEYQKMVESLEKQSTERYNVEKSLRYKEAYLRSILNHLTGPNGEMSGQVNALFNFVAELPEDFVMFNYFDDPILNIQFTSDPLPADTIASNALSRWEEAYAVYSGL